MQMSKVVGYKAAPTNENRGNKTHGSFKNDGQKQGKKSMAGKEKQKSTKLDVHLKQLAKGMMKASDHKNNAGMM